MPVGTYAVDDLFVLRIIKHHHNNFNDKWVNTYEFKATEVGGETELLILAEAWVNFEKQIHHEEVDFDRFTISTWEADSVPYDPESFISVSIGGPGGTPSTIGILPINQVLNVTRVAASGRFGHLYYRGVLDQADVEAPAGISTLVDPAGVQSRITDTLVSSNAGDSIGSAPDLSLSLVMVNKTGTQVRTVNGLFAAGTTTVPTDHAWFNRTSP